jgi:hypothetical protein
MVIYGRKWIKEFNAFFILLFLDAGASVMMNENEDVE